MPHSAFRLVPRYLIRRILADRSIYDELVDRLAQRAWQIRVGAPSDPATEVGALIHPSHYERVMSYVHSGLDEGARLVAGGQRPAHLPVGNYLAPTAGFVHRNLAAAGGIRAAAALHYPWHQPRCGEVIFSAPASAIATKNSE